MEKDDEVKGVGNSYTTDFRLYDPRIGRWLTIDPIEHPWQSPYCAFDNNPIVLVDPMGTSSGDPQKKVTGANGGSYMIPESAETKYSIGDKVYTFSYNGDDYWWDEDSQGYSTLSGKQYEAVSGDGYRKWAYIKQSGDIKYNNERPWLAYVGKNGNYFSDSEGWGDFGSAENLALNVGSNIAEAVNSVYDDHFGPFNSAFYIGDPSDFIKEEIAWTAVTFGVGAGLKWGIKGIKHVWKSYNMSSRL